MKTCKFAFLAFFISVSTIGILKAETPSFSLTIQDGSRVWLEGDSTLHPFKSTATVVQLDSLFEGSTQNVLEAEIKKFDVVIPVAGLRSGEKGLDKNLYKALKSADHLNITFSLTDKKLNQGSGHTNGNLSIAGKEKPVQLVTEFETTATGVRVRGNTNLLMTDFGVKPPTIMGVIRTRNEIVIRFDLELALKK